VSIAFRSTNSMARSVILRRPPASKSLLASASDTPQSRSSMRHPSSGRVGGTGQIAPPDQSGRMLQKVKMAGRIEPRKVVQPPVLLSIATDRTVHDPFICRRSCWRGCEMIVRGFWSAGKHQPFVVGGVMPPCASCPAQDPVTRSPALDRRKSCRPFGPSGTRHRPRAMRCWQIA
jgi:hypothetical protein